MAAEKNIIKIWNWSLYAEYSNK